MKQFAEPEIDILWFTTEDILTISTSFPDDGENDIGWG